jgi:hypothetical protein
MRAAKIASSRSTSASRVVIAASVCVMSLLPLFARSVL